jgi:hypothetical protein
MGHTGKKGLFFELVVLTIETVKATGMVEYGQILVSQFRPFGTGIARIAASGACWTHKAGHAVGREGIIVKGDIALMGASPFQLSIPNLAKPAKTGQPFWNLALVQTYVAGNALRITWRLYGQAVGLTTPGMNLRNLRPDFRKMPPDAICTETNHIGDRLARRSTETTPTHGVSPSASQKGRWPDPWLLSRVTWALSYQAHKQKTPPSRSSWQTLP